MNYADRVRKHLNKDKPPVEKAESSYRPSEIRDAWDDFTYEWAGSIRFCKYALIGMSLMGNVIAMAMWSSWSDFVASPCYQRVITR